MQQFSGRKMAFSLDFVGFHCRRPLIPTTPATSYSSDSYVYSTTTPTSHPSTTAAHALSGLPASHAAKERKLSVALPLATLRVTMETSSIATNRDDEQPLSPTEDDQKLAEESTHISEESTKINDDEMNHVESITHNESDDAIESEGISEKFEETTSVEQRLRRISEAVERYSNDNENAENHGPKSFLTITDLINTLQPADKKVMPRIDSDYSNTMHVLGETASIVGGDDSRKIKTIDLRQTNRALY